VTKTTKTQFSLNTVRGIAFLLFLICAIYAIEVRAQSGGPFMDYTVTSLTTTHYFHVQLQTGSWNQDTINFKMPKWTPGYYQLLNYGNAVENVVAKDDNGILSVRKMNDNTWSVTGTKNKKFTLSYDVKAEKQFVAQSYLDSTRAYLVPASVFLYADGYLNKPATIKIEPPKKWKIATGLDSANGMRNGFSAPDFDILYDCPVLMGNLDELPSFSVRGVEHRFIGYQVGSFDRAQFMQNLKKVVEASVAIIGDVPYKRYTFIAIGPGRGGIEHLNNTTFSFNGNDLHSAEAMNRMMNFLAHEYFHHYNVKRIRPFELGPFDYDQGSRTNQLWVSEGLSVYYEYLIVKRAGLANEQTLFNDFEKNINATENNPGRFYQSLTQASYKTWSDGPFGTQGEDAGKSISYYDKGPVIGLLLDFTIRHATQNKKSLDDVMRLLYWKYYKELQRGFTDAEFEQACETVAGTSLANFFDYVYTTKEIDYTTCLSYAGLRLERKDSDTGKVKKFAIRRLEKMDELQAAVLNSWLGN